MFRITGSRLYWRSGWMQLCTPGMGVNLWGESPLYVNPVKCLNHLTQVLAEGKGGTARDRLKEAGAQSDEPTNRNSIQGPVSGQVSTT